VRLHQCQIRVRQRGQQPIARSRCNVTWWMTCWSARRHGSCSQKGKSTSGSLNRSRPKVAASG